MKNTLFLILILLNTNLLFGQDLSQGLTANDMSNHPMQDIAKPAYLEAFVDPSFGTTIRRITNAEPGSIIKPLYSTIQAWNADESYMVVLDVTNDVHQLLNGLDYSFIRNLNDVNPDDEEQIFWSHSDPDVFYYVDNKSNELIRYHVSSQEKDVIVDLLNAADQGDMVSLGNDIQMQSWDDDVFGFRTSSSGNNNNLYYYKISTNSVTAINVAGTANSWTAPMPGPSGQTIYHGQKSYDANGNLIGALELERSHNCTGKLTNGNDALFSVNFDKSPIANLVAYDLTDPSVFFPIISQSLGYPYPKTGTHISSLAHKNTNGSWVAVSMIGYDEDGQSLLDQEIVIAKADPNSPDVYRIGHHRSDENEFDYYGEPHVSISPSGTRVLFGSDWSGAEDGQSVNCYVIELPVFKTITSLEDDPNDNHLLYPNPLTNTSKLTFDNTDHLPFTFVLNNALGQLIYEVENITTDSIIIERNELPIGVYIYHLISKEKKIKYSGKIVIK